ncbi:MAG: hypothetical protein ACQEWW_26425 [Bacillota bacterium]
MGKVMIKAYVSNIRFTFEGDNMGGRHQRYLRSLTVKYALKLKRFGQLLRNKRILEKIGKVHQKSKILYISGHMLLLFCENH